MAQLADGVVAYGSASARYTDLASATPRGPRGFAGAGGGGFAAAGHQGLYERDDSDGYPLPPCQKQMRAGILTDIYWPVEPGTRTFKIMVRHSGHSPAPRIIVKANPEVGVLDDVEAVASVGTEWQELVVQVTVTAKGVLNVWREVRSQDQGAYAKWDQVTVT